ncbi:MAG: CHAT domain-containing protein, partial [Planctomycetota bacterium]
KVFEVRSRTLPDDHPDLQKARQGLAITKRALGDLKGALALQQKACDVLSRTLPDDHPNLQAARSNLASTKKALGDLKGALALFQKAFDVLSRTLPDDHPDLQRARQNLATTKHTLGDLKGALALDQKVFDVLSRTLPNDHPNLQAARQNLLWTSHFLGLGARAAELVRDWLWSGRRAMMRWSLSPRQLGSLAAQWLPAFDAGLTLAVEDADAAPAVAGHVLLATESLRGIEVRSACRSRLAVSAGKTDEVDRLRERIRHASDQLVRSLRRTVPRDDPDAESKLESLRDEQHAALLEKENAEQELAVLVKTVGGLDHGRLSTKDLAGRLPSGAAAASVVRFTHHRRDQKSGEETGEPRMVALCLSRQDKIDLVPLGPAEGIEDLASGLRALHGGNDTRSPMAPGRRPDAARPDKLKLLAQLDELVMAPILKAVGPVETLYLSVDEALGLVPLDALPGPDGKPIGESVRIVPLVSLLELMEPRLPPEGDKGNSLLVVGAVTYGATAKTDGKTKNGRTKNVDRSALAAAPVLPESTRDGEGPYAALPGTEREVGVLRKLFTETFKDGTATLLTADRASKLQLREAVPGVRFVHIASHGYFAPEDVASTLDNSRGRTAELMGHIKQQIQGLSPLVLTGLALSGANQRPGVQGYTDGIITAEEILALDLTCCELATLSACDTSLGIRRAGQGYASLRAALQGAGARYVLTSLWKVGDENTRKLMVDFYRRMWVDKKPPRQALWEAKMKALKDGIPFRDWAGWVLTGI